MQSTIQYIKTELGSDYPDTEIQGFIKILLEYLTGWNYTQQQLYRDSEISDALKKEVELIIERIKKHEPIQYILGETEFFGLKMKVTPAVLIPRPETEELVKLVLDCNENKNARILDIGTGSGCIALALKYFLKDADVSGVDISEEALEIARENAALNQLSVNFIKSDILKWEESVWRSYDIIVSNPPYVRESEKLLMNNNVTDYEPGKALFVSDNDPLIFYRRIAEFAKQKMNINGQLFFEINEFLAFDMEKLLKSMDFENVMLRKDINNKYRMINCTRKSVV